MLTRASHYQNKYFKHTLKPTTGTIKLYAVGDVLMHITFTESLCMHSSYVMVSWVDLGYCF